MSCYYKGRTPMDNNICLSCPLFLETFTPVASEDGFSFGECDL